MTPVVPPADDADPPRARGRADAERNRTRVAEAAALVFAEHGLDATVAQVADRARVGNATVYRNYPSKTELLSEVALRWLVDWRTALRAAADAGDVPFREVFLELYARLRGDRLALDLLRAGAIDDEVTAARAEVEALFTASLDAAVADGLVRPGITYADLSVLILGTAGRLSEIGETDAATWRHVADMIWAGIATG